MAWLTQYTAPYFINPSALDWGPRYGFIWFPSACIAALWVFLFLPEVKGRKLEEIDEMVTYPRHYLAGPLANIKLSFSSRPDSQPESSGNTCVLVRFGLRRRNSAGLAVRKMFNMMRRYEVSNAGLRIAN
jgi:hypothetical protein